MSHSALKLKTTASIAALLVSALWLPATSVSAQERCPAAPIDVTGALSEEFRLACSAAHDALQLLGRCQITPRRALRLQILGEVRHPLSGPIFGLFDTKQEIVRITQYLNIPSLIKNTPYSELPLREFYQSLIVHEVIHGVMHQNMKQSATNRAAYEYPAYALQIESLPKSVRDKFLRTFDQKAIAADSVFSDSILLFDPFFFAARAYQHFRSSGNGCAHIRALLEGDVDFIAASP